MNARTAIRALIAIVVIVLIVIILNATGLLKKVPGASGNTSQWQAVFLINGQVYFGQVKSETNKELVLENIYYLQVEQQLQPAQNQTNQQPQLSLIKLGNELHGPKDRMRINRQQVIFIEDLKDDGRVVTAINDFVKSGGQATTPPAAQTSPAPATTTSPATR